MSSANDFILEMSLSEVSYKRAKDFERASSGDLSYTFTRMSGLRPALTIKDLTNNKHITVYDKD